LAKTWVDFRDDDDVWIAILTGAGKAFCVGADLQSIGEPGIQVGFNVLRESPHNYMVYKPIIAAVNGIVIGRGMSLMLGCDLRIASDTAQFSIPEVKFGVIPGDPDVLERFATRSMACEMLLTGDSITAQRAYEIGLVNKVVPPDKVMPEAIALAEKLRGNSPIAMRGIKEMLSKTKDVDYRTPVSIYENVNARVLKSKDYPEGMQAMRERRKPDWQGK
jgi:enoyl-CoA hydratase/carnithine racemase